MILARLAWDKLKEDFKFREYANNPDKFMAIACDVILLVLAIAAGLSFIAIRIIWAIICGFFTTIFEAAEQSNNSNSREGMTNEELFGLWLLYNDMHERDMKKNR